MRTVRTLVAAVLAAALALTACATQDQKNNTDSSGDAPVKVAVVYSRTGLLSAYGAQYVAGLKAGLDYATKGTGKVGDHRIEITYADDGGQPARAVSAMKQYAGQGYKIVAGTDDSGIATQLSALAEQNKLLYINGPAATDAVTGANRYTFRSGRQTYQDVATAGTIIGDPKGKKILVFAQDSTFGQGNAAAVQTVLGGKGATVSKLLVPATTTDFTPFARQAKQAGADLVFVAWAGTTTTAMWQALDQQGVLASTTVTTGLANQASFATYGPSAAKIKFLSYYFPQAVDNPVNQALVKSVAAGGGQADLFSPDGFVAGQMIVRAVEKGNGTDVEAMIGGLEGWRFDGPKGSITVRAADHAMLQPMFQAQLTKQGDTWKPTLVRTVPADTTAPPVKSS